MPSAGEGLCCMCPLRRPSARGMHLMRAVWMIRLVKRLYSLDMKLDTARLGKLSFDRERHAWKTKGLSNISVVIFVQQLRKKAILIGLHSPAQCRSSGSFDLYCLALS